MYRFFIFISLLFDLFKIYLSYKYIFMEKFKFKLYGLGGLILAFVLLFVFILLNLPKFIILIPLGVIAFFFIKLSIDAFKRFTDIDDEDE